MTTVKIAAKTESRGTRRPADAVVARARAQSRPRARASGFSLLELTIAMTIFVAVSGIAFSLFNQEQIASRSLQGRTALNVALRNAAAELQMDIASAGSGYFQGVNMPSWPISVTILNNMSSNGTACDSYNATTKTTNYGVTCFDQLTVITAATPSTTYPGAINAIGSTGLTGSCSDVSTGNAYGQAAVVNGTTWTLAKTAAGYAQGDQLLFMNNTGTLVSTAVLTSAPVVSGSVVKFTFHATNPDGSNQIAYDPLDITACDGYYGTTYSSGSTIACNNTYGTVNGVSPYATFTNQFCSSAYILKLAPIIYLVCSGPGSNTTWCDQSSSSPDIQDPKLVRIQNGTKNVVMEQVIGFRAGAALWNGASEQNDTDSVTTTYNYQAKTYQFGIGSSSIPAPWNFSLVRAVRISLIGRTSPSNTDNEFKNAFDQGPYQVQGIALVVNPRNSSMNDTP